MIGDVADRARAYGRVEDPDVLQAMETDDWVGRSITLTSRDDGVNLVAT